MWLVVRFNCIHDSIAMWLVVRFNCVHDSIATWLVVRFNCIHDSIAMWLHMFRKDFFCGCSLTILGLYFSSTHELMSASYLKFDEFEKKDAQDHGLWRNGILGSCPALPGAETRTLKR